MFWPCGAGAGGGGGGGGDVKLILIHICVVALRYLNWHATYWLQASRPTAQEWVATTLTTMEAEFPAWHLLSCFDIFHLSCTTASKKRGPETEEALVALATAFGLDAKELSQQYVSTMHTALALQKKGGLENRAAWVEALKHFEGRAAMRQKYGTDALKEAGYWKFTMN